MGVVRTDIAAGSERHDGGTVTQSCAGTVGDYGQGSRDAPEQVRTKEKIPGQRISCAGCPRDRRTNPCWYARWERIKSRPDGVRNIARWGQACSDFGV